jgi:GntR family transcriptional regulator, transcriptional repressor for pyruvate dehydrogenase complex
VASRDRGSGRGVDWAVLGGGQSTSGRLAVAVTRMIHDGNLLPGDRIPTERELAELVGMSRATVREALRELELRGLLDRKPGRGTVVVDQQRPHLDAGLLAPVDSAGRLLREVMDLRAVVEPPISERAAARGTAAEIADLQTLLDEGAAAAREGVPSFGRYAVLDVEFHLALARMTHNPLLSRLLQVTNEWMAPSRQSALQSARRIEVSLQAHRKIFAAVAARDPAAAAAAMHEHLEQIQRLIAARVS